MGMRESGPEALRIVAIGGGTGLSTLLHGLKQIILLRTPESGELPPIDLTAVVTVSDDGGSSGRLRREFDVLPPGDIRNCMVAMSEDETLLSRLFQYRFESGRGLKGHSFGNLFLTALTNLTGDFASAVQLSSEVLAICGRIFPATDCNVVLEAEMEDGDIVRGETRISRASQAIRRIHLVPASCDPLPQTLDAIARADLITLGPGSLFTSVVPNLLVNGVSEAIADSPALKACFVNLMWQPGETMHFRASDHVAAIHDHAGRAIVDYAVVNTRPITPTLKRRYAEEQARPVENDFERLSEMQVAVIGIDLAAESDKVRHDSDAAAKVAVDLAMRARARRQAQMMVPASVAR